MQRITLEELKHILYHAFRDHLTMKDIENIIINEEESLNETSGNCQTEFEGAVSLRAGERCGGKLVGLGLSRSQAPGQSIQTQVPTSPVWAQRLHPGASIKGHDRREQEMMHTPSSQTTEERA
ncbi:hypothetical protein P7K49_004256 [Saguinus oedipus]|uniref:Calcium-binding protein 8 n=1 Tax=Saguinus oedipus TaxID=9490 RepID=A0ABQ9W7A6_SAGOE|nr:hypothetical protein P7K49_004256 [Saguinus oedipus]